MNRETFAEAYLGEAKEETNGASYKEGGIDRVLESWKARRACAPRSGIGTADLGDSVTGRVIVGSG